MKSVFPSKNETLIGLVPFFAHFLQGFLLSCFSLVLFYEKINFYKKLIFNRE